jgi:hypothetical protein
VIWPLAPGWPEFLTSPSAYWLLATLVSMLLPELPAPSHQFLFCLNIFLFAVHLAWTIFPQVFAGLPIYGALKLK